MLPPLLETTYSRYKRNQDCLATFLAVTGQLCGAPEKWTKQHPAANMTNARERPAPIKDKARKRDGKNAGEVPSSKTPKTFPLRLSSYVPLAEHISKSKSVHIPSWLLGTLRKILKDRSACHEYFCEGGVTEALNDGHLHIIDRLRRVLEILQDKHDNDARQADASKPTHPSNSKSANSFCGLSVDGLDVHESEGEAEAEDKAEAQAASWMQTRKELWEASDDADGANLEATSLDEALFALTSFLQELKKLRAVIREAWTSYANGDVELTSVAIMTNTAIDLARNLEREVMPAMMVYHIVCETREQGVMPLMTADHFICKPRKSPLECNELLASMFTKNYEEGLLGVIIYQRLYVKLLDRHGAGADQKVAVDEAAVWEHYDDMLLFSFQSVNNARHFFFDLTLDRPSPVFRPVVLPPISHSQYPKIREEYLHSTETLIKLLNNLCLLGSGTMLAFPFADEVSHGLGFCSENTGDASFHMWAVFGFQVLLDIDAVLIERSHNDTPFKELRRFMAESEAFTDNIMDRFAEFGDGGQKERLALRAHSRLLDASKQDGFDEMPRTLSYLCTGAGAARLAEEATQSEFFLLRRHPLYCGLLLHSTKLHLQTLGVKLEQKSSSILDMAHCWNACQKEGLIHQVWNDLELLVMKHQPRQFFLNGQPSDKSSTPGYLHAYLICIGATPSLRIQYNRVLAKMQTLRTKAPKPKGFEKAWDSLEKALRNLVGKFGSTRCIKEDAVPVSLMFKDRLLYRSECREYWRPEDVEFIINKASDDQQHRADSAKRRQSSKPGPPQLADILEKLLDAINRESAQLTFPTLSLHQDCCDILAEIEQAICAKETRVTGKGRARGMEDSPTEPGARAVLMVLDFDGVGGVANLQVAATKINEFLRRGGGSRAVDFVTSMSAASPRGPVHKASPVVGDESTTASPTMCEQDRKKQTRESWLRWALEARRDSEWVGHE